MRASVELDLDASVVDRGGSLSFQPRATSRPAPTRDELEVAPLSARLVKAHADEAFLVLYDVSVDGAELGLAVGHAHAGTVFRDADGSPLANLEAFAAAAGEGGFLVEGRLGGLVGGLSSFGLRLDRLDLSEVIPGASDSPVTTTATFHEDGLEVIEYREARSRER